MYILAAPVDDCFIKEYASAFLTFLPIIAKLCFIATPYHKIPYLNQKIAFLPPSFPGLAFRRTLSSSQGLTMHFACVIITRPFRAGETGATHAGVAELADARDLKSRGSDPVPVRPRSPAPYRGVEQLVARRAHNPEVAGSSPASATIRKASLSQGSEASFCSFCRFFGTYFWLLIVAPIHAYLCLFCRYIVAFATFARRFRRYVVDAPSLWSAPLY